MQAKSSNTSFMAYYFSMNCEICLRYVDQLLIFLSVKMTDLEGTAMGKLLGWNCKLISDDIFGLGLKLFWNLGIFYKEIFVCKNFADTLWNAQQGYGTLV